MGSTRGPVARRVSLSGSANTAVRRHGTVMAMGGAAVAPGQSDARTMASSVGNGAVLTRTVLPWGEGIKSVASATGQTTEGRSLGQTPRAGIIFNSQGSHTGAPIHYSHKASGPRSGACGGM